MTDILPAMHKVDWKDQLSSISQKIFTTAELARTEILYDEGELLNTKNTKIEDPS